MNNGKKHKLPFPGVSLNKQAQQNNSCLEQREREAPQLREQQEPEACLIKEDEELQGSQEEEQYELREQRFL